MRWICAAAVFLSSLLLFLIQPIAANVMLPHFGGAASVWTISMLFFPAVLLAGYVYSHWLQRFAPPLQRLVHSAVAMASVALLPIHIVTSSAVSPDQPALQVLATLVGSIGLPYFVLSTTSPLVQAWFARARGGALPYWLFGVSNGASLLALAAYPFALEPWLRKSEQQRLWSAGYLAFLIALAVTAFATRRAAIAAKPQQGEFSPIWLALSATPAALWLAVANQMSHAVAPVPLLWILPLSVYLLTMVICFSTSWYRPGVFRWLLPVGVAALCATAYPMNWRMTLLLFLAGLFLCAMTCHGELAMRKPGENGLTAFYVTVAAGGAIGSAFVSLLAPLIFREYLELPVSIVACVLLAVALLYGYNQPRHVIRLAVVGLVALVAATGAAEHAFVRARNFYGAIEVREDGTGTGRCRSLYNGSVLHGLQFLAPERSREATTYYSPKSGVGMELAPAADHPRRVGVVGLGAGTLAAYGRPGDVYRFYEINPLVVDLANQQFRFLKESGARVEVLPGDARLMLEKESPQAYDVLVLDAFAGDAVPVHLLTREAFEIYARHLKPGGVVAAHVSSRYLNLTPLVIRVGASVGFESKVAISSRDSARQITSATWVLLRHTSLPKDVPDIWTDDYSSLLGVL